MAFDFSGKKILVTGAGRGIGRGIALGLAEAGCKVYALDCVAESLDSLATENANIVTIHQDLSNWDETKVTLEKLEVLDGLVNNAGIHLGMCPALEETKANLERCMTINCLAYINCIQVIAKKMVDEGKKGSIVNISSQASLKSSYAGGLAYSVSKAGVDMVTKQFALEFGPHNIRVNSVNQMAVETELIRAIASSVPALLQTRIERAPLGRIAQIEDIVGPVMYLLSDYAAMVTGTMHLIDGGTNCNITTKQ